MMILKSIGAALALLFCAGATDAATYPTGETGQLHPIELTVLWSEWRCGAGCDPELMPKPESDPKYLGLAAGETATGTFQIFHDIYGGYGNRDIPWLFTISLAGKYILSGELWLDDGVTLTNRNDSANELKQYSWDGRSGSLRWTTDDEPYFISAGASFVSLAPVPLPASAALLPLGLAGLSLLRRRGRAAA